MNKMEKVILGLSIAVFIGVDVSCNLLISAIEESGGLRSMVIDAGKDVKQIYKEINEDEQ